jgi:(1->4)-alpha-D-glucan 1-alpha-D-glucosylmutase
LTEPSKGGARPAPTTVPTVAPRAGGRVPRATYRLQLHAGFGFDAAASITDYLAALGVSHAYCSPYLQAVSGSTHGYDVVDYTRVNEELGGEAEHRRFVAALKANGLGQVLDVVPNHMAITGPENRWWWDVLENGHSSLYGLYFDVAWDPPEPRLRHRILLPVLGDHYGRVLERGELRVDRQRGRFRIRYYDSLAPVAPASLDLLLAPVAELSEIAGELSALPEVEADDRTAVEARHERKEKLLAQLDALLDSETIAEAVDAELEALNADPDRLDALLERQHYRVARWQTAGWDLDYRRFFDINTLAAIRAMDPRVFEDSHRLVLTWVAEGSLDGLRIDHPDGLRDPAGYFERLSRAAPSAWIVAEKVLQPGEKLPRWPIAGTTGYEFGARCIGLFVDPRGEEPLTRLYEELTAEVFPYREVVHRKKHQVLRQLLAPDLNRLVALFLQVCERRRSYRDYTRREVEQALRELIACFPVYRTYVRPSTGEVSAGDRHRIAEAAAAGRENRPDLEPELFDFIRDVLLLQHRGDVEDEFTWRFQQTTGPVMAKAVEDTAFYTYNRLVCLNEVGGDPDMIGLSPDDFHAACAEAAEQWPHAMLSTSTHDTKRSEDVRARLACVSEIPERWAVTVHGWTDMNRHLKAAGVPDANTEYLLYQTLVGAYPLATDRAVSYMEKASKEAKTHTSWINPDPDYDAGLKSFVEAVVAHPDFVSSLRAFVNWLTQPGRVNSLALKVLALTCPGVPDLYQGSELWDLSLVDPDNRRPVDYESRRRLLAELDGLSAGADWERAEEGLPKLLVVKRALELRAERPEAFERGSYRPLAAAGAKAEHVVAFTRREEVVTVVPRLVVGLGSGWGDTVVELPPGRWRNRLTGAGEQGVARVAMLLEEFPVALLARER